MSPPYFHQASIWLSIVTEFDWKSVNLIHSTSSEGKMVAAKFLYLADHHEVKVKKLLKISDQKMKHLKILK